ncbi:hypothetical protein R1flu_004059 [Riccia fluitans]|uniref:Uncharacterized protein n=1 Tax=Riccia fluitans TaxID=41844 RepID=A0ABD1YPL3_9MARC
MGGITGQGRLRVRPYHPGSVVEGGGHYECLDPQAPRPARSQRRIHQPEWLVFGELEGGSDAACIHRLPLRGSELAMVAGVLGVEVLAVMQLISKRIGTAWYQGMSRAAECRGGGNPRRERDSRRSAGLEGMQEGAKFSDGKRGRPRRTASVGSQHSRTPIPTMILGLSGLRSSSMLVLPSMVHVGIIFVHTSVPLTPTIPARPMPVAHHVVLFEASRFG